MSKNFREIVRFELQETFASPLYWVTGLFFALLTFGAVSSDSVRIGGSIGTLHRNAPFVILQLLTVMSVVAIFVTTTFVAGAALRDFERRTHELFFSKAITKLEYLAGRFTGSFLASVGVMVLCGLGIVIATLMPWIEAKQLGSFMAGPYLFALAVMVIPNLALSGALFFALAAASRSWRVTYVGVVVFFAGYLISALLLSDPQLRTFGALLDPFGASALNLATRYWTVAEKNSLLPPFSGLLLWNRLLWSGIGLAILIGSIVTFRPTPTGSTRGFLSRFRRLTVPPGEPSTAAVGRRGRAKVGLTRSARDFSPGATFSLFLHSIAAEAQGVLRSIPFLVMLAFGMFNLVGGFPARLLSVGTKVYPVTALMLDHLQGRFVFLLVIIVIFYAGEVVWRERSVNLSEVYGALPIPTWVPLLSKVGALWVVVLVFLAAGGATAVGIQLWHGYRHVEPALYAKGLGLVALPFLLFAVLVIFLQVLTQRKFAAHLAIIAYLVLSVVLGAFHFDHRLYRFAETPPVIYSDMNGYGHFLRGYAWYTLYWAWFSLLLIVGAALLWVRGCEVSWRLRLRRARARFRGPRRVLFAVGFAGWVATGAWIFWNTNVLNAYVPSDESKQRQAEYERKYRRYRDLVVPRIVETEAEVDIFPDRRRVEIAGRYLLKNKSSRPESEIEFLLDPRVKVRRLSLDPKWRTLFDPRLGLSIYELPEPLAPGAEMELTFVLSVQETGFVNRDSDTSLVENGTFFNNGQYLPRLAYDDSRELQSRGDRRRYGLPRVERMAKLEDSKARRNNYLSGDADWIRLGVTVSTRADQIALAAGSLKREWRVGNRRYFRYETDRPIENVYSFLSARWAVRKERWRPKKENVAIEVYYHPAHPYDVDRMIDAAKKSLDYYTGHFSPYPHRQLRIAETPRYTTTAPSFPGTIPFSEGLGFIADRRDPKDADYAFYVTAREVARQWWGQQVVGGNVQGATMLSESLAQYSALMVMQKEFGKEKMRRFLKRELDQYLEGRSGEPVEEMPLMRVENQPYIGERKGGLVFYALEDAIGEETVNRALARYLAQVAYQEPPYTYTPDLLAILREETPPARQGLLHDLFETITLYDLKATHATWTRRADGKYLVKLTVEAKKLRADGRGVETPVPLSESIDIGVFGETRKDGRKQETVLYLAKHNLRQGTATFELLVDGKPIEAGIDPLNQWIDRISGDNRTQVTKAASGPLRPPRS